MNQRQLEYWAKIRQRGQKRYALLNGALGWGLTTWLPWSLIMTFMEPDADPIVRSAIGLVLFPIGGYFWGMWFWGYLDRRYGGQTDTGQSRTVIRELMDKTRSRRVLIVKRENGSYGYEEELWSDESREQCWVPQRQMPLSVCDTEETALREARGRVAWLSADLRERESDET